ncbi:MAG: hypothetical protein HC933_00245 [Pleurocapsa sp. SU_196_0]|nr:hypothetical protein [Pleurocapsa sp. SU_196_0]
MIPWLETLRRLHRLGSSLCAPVDTSKRVWQLRTASGVRLLSLNATVSSVLERACCGVHSRSGAGPTGCI